MSLNAFVTLITTDAYVPGALVTVHSVLEAEGASPAHPFETVCLVTPATLSVESIKALRRNFSLVVGVEEIRSGSNAELRLLGRLRFTPWSPMTLLMLICTLSRPPRSRFNPHKATPIPPHSVPQSHLPRCRHAMLAASIASLRLGSSLLGCAGFRMARLLQQRDVCRHTLSKDFRWPHGDEQGERILGRWRSRTLE